MRNRYRAWTQLSTSLKYLPLIIVFVCALPLIGGAQPYWDTANATLAITGGTIVTAPIAAALSCFDSYRILKPTWAATFPMLKRPGFLFLTSITSTLAAWLAAHIIAISMGIAISAYLGNTVTFDPWLLANGLPLLAAGVPFGAWVGTVLRNLLAPALVAILGYLVIIKRYLWNEIVLSTPIAEDGPATTINFNATHIQVKALLALLIAVVFIIMLCATRLQLRQTVPFAAIACTLVLCLMALSTTAGFVTSGSNDKPTVALKCAGESPRVCLPVGTDGYRHSVAEQLNEHYHLYQELGVQGPTEFRQSWQSYQDTKGNKGKLPTMPPANWAGTYDNDDIAHAMASPSLKLNCFPRNEADAEKHAIVTEWFQAKIEHREPEFDPPATTADVKESYNSMRDCQVKQ